MRYELIKSKSMIISAKSPAPSDGFEMLKMISSRGSSCLSKVSLNPRLPSPDKDKVDKGRVSPISLLNRSLDDSYSNDLKTIKAKAKEHRSNSVAQNAQMIPQSLNLSVENYGHSRCN